jgi:hypothetical protein
VEGSIVNEYGAAALGVGLIAAAAFYGDTQHNRASDVPQGPDRATVQQEMDAIKGPTSEIVKRPGESDADWCNRQDDNWTRAGADTSEMYCNGKPMSYWRAQRHQGA